ncbi:MAG: hypothetical protein JWM00_607 [Candidatus Saccharibacteria bacterium]|nr:hypothetical protein [Candidatus Saccharibacteria bacterium]
MIFGYLLILSVVGGGLFALIIIIGVALFDIQKIRKQRVVNRHPYRRRYRERPLVSVLVMATSNQQAMKDCLVSLVKSKYKKIEIIIVDTLPRSKVRRLVEEYVQAGLTERIVTFTTKRSEGMAVVAAYRRHGNGEIITIIDGVSVVEPHIFNRIVWEFNADQRIRAVGINDQLIPSMSSIRILQTYENFFRKLSSKTKSAFNISHATPHVNIAYRKDALLTSTFGHKQHRTAYASDAILYRDAASSLYTSLSERLHWQRITINNLIAHRSHFFTLDTNYSKFATWVYLPFTIYLGLVALLLPLLLGYFIYLVVEVRQPLLFILSWVVLGIFLLFAVWSDEHLGRRRKLIYSILLPTAFVAAYLLSLLQLFATVGVIASLRRHH